MVEEFFKGNKVVHKHKYNPENKFQKVASA